MLSVNFLHHVEYDTSDERREGKELADYLTELAYADYCLSVEEGDPLPREALQIQMVHWHHKERHDLTIYKKPNWEAA